MLLNLYAVYDKVAEEAGPMFGSVNDGVAVRQTLSLLAEMPRRDDYQLYRIGQYNTNTMSVFVDPKPMEVVLPGDKLGE